MGIDSYIEIEKPEEKTSVEVIENPYQNIMSAFTIWSTAIIQARKRNSEDYFYLLKNKDFLLEEATQLLSGKALPKELGEKRLPILSFLDKNLNASLGFFYTALLNAGVKKIVIPNYGYFRFMRGLGYKLQKGILESHVTMQEKVGELAAGGCILNYGDMENLLGYGATGGIFINKGTCLEMGPSNGGFFINMGSIFHSINIPESTCVNYLIKNGIIHFHNSRYRLAIGITELTGQLGNLAEQLHNAIKQDNIPAITKLSSKIQNHLTALCQKL